MRSYVLLLTVLLHSIARADGALYGATEVDLDPPVPHLLHANAPIKSVFLLPDRSLIFRVQDSEEIFSAPLPTTPNWDLTEATALPFSLPAAASLELVADSLSGAPLIDVRIERLRIGVVTLSPARLTALPPLTNDQALLADLDGDAIPDRLSLDPTTGGVFQNFVTTRAKRWATLPADFHPSFIAALHLNADQRPDLLAVDARNRWCVALTSAAGELAPCEPQSGYRGNKEIPIPWVRPTMLRSGTPKLALFDSQNRQWAIATPSLRPVDQFRSLGAPPVGMNSTVSTSGDFNGDGEDDIVIIDTDARYPLLLQSGPGAIERELRGAPLPILHDAGIGAADTNGDSLADLMIFSASAQTVWLSTTHRVTPPQNIPVDRPCIGLNPGNNQRWGRLARERCPKGYAVMEADDVSGKKEPTASNMGTLCCPLRVDDLLTEEISLSSERCPENAVAVGADFDGERYQLSCARINTARYRLAPAEPGVYWGLGFSRPVFGGRFVSKHELPAALRHGVGRRSLRSWDPDGCVGASVGSLLISRDGPRCQGLTFAQVLDRTTGAPVPLLPECRTVEAIFSEAPRCER